MKIFVSADIEGCAGVFNTRQTKNESGLYTEAKETMTHEVKALCEGALARDPHIEEILVKDAHGEFTFNLFPHKLPAGVRVHKGWSGFPACMMDCLDKSFSLAAYVGYHTGSGMDGNPLSHTFSGITRINVNDHAVTEFEMNAMYAAELGIPSLFLSGDEQMCEIAKEWDPRVETVVCSRGIGNGSIAEHPLTAQNKIKEGIMRAVDTYKNGAKPKSLPTTFEVELVCTMHQHAYWASFFPEVELVKSKNFSSIRFARKSWFEALRVLHYITYYPHR